MSCIEDVVERETKISTHTPSTQLHHVKTLHDARTIGLDPSIVYHHNNFHDNPIKKQHKSFQSTFPRDSLDQQFRRAPVFSQPSDFLSTVTAIPILKTDREVPSFDQPQTDSLLRPQHQIDSDFTNRDVPKFQYHAKPFKPSQRLNIDTKFYLDKVLSSWLPELGALSDVDSETSLNGTYQTRTP